MENTLEAAIREEVIQKAERNPYGFAILMGLNFTGKHVYAGTVPAAEKARRRAKNRAARASRRKNRG